MATYSNIYIDQGSSYSSVIDVKDSNGLPLNLTDYESRGQIRKSYSSTAAVPFTSEINLPLEGKVSLSLTAAQTRSIKAGRYLYSVEVYNDAGHVLRVAEGQVEINPGSADPDGNIPLPPTPTLSEIIDDRIDDKLVLKAPLASPTFTGDVVVDGSIKLSQIPTYADNFAASSLSIGSVYKTPTGELRIKY